MAPHRDRTNPGQRKLIASNRRARHHYEIVDSIRGRHRAHRKRGEVAARGARPAGRLVRPGHPRADVARRGAHPALPVRQGVRLPRAGPVAQAPAPRARDRAPRPPDGHRATQLGAPRPLLQGRPGEGRARPRPRPPQDRQAPGDGRNATPSWRSPKRWCIAPRGASDGHHPTRPGAPTEPPPGRRIGHPPRTSAG